jgi:TrmH family RNA methyltransferase
MTKNEIQLIRSLADKRAREENGLFVAEGQKLVCELMSSGFRIRKIYKVGSEVSQKDMARASHLKTPTDCLALVEIPHREFNPASVAAGLTLALDGVQNPGNMGTIIRLADWFGIRTVLASGDSADCFNPKVVQATMGAITRVEVHYGDLAAMIGDAVVAPLPVYGTFLDGENIYSAPLTTEGIIVLGSEGRGISAPVGDLVTRRLFIPPCPANGTTSESLNVAIAAAIICSEFRRPRHAIPACQFG